MNKTFKLLALACITIAAAGPAAALTFTNSSAQGGSAAADYSAAGLLAFDIDFANPAAVSLSYTVDADDLSMPIEMNAVLRNFTLGGFTGYEMTLSRGSFASVGTALQQFTGAAAMVNASGGHASLRFMTPETLDVEIGDALGTTPGAMNWTLSGLQAGDTLTVSVSAVPEPQTSAMWLAGLLTMGFLTARRKA